MIATIIVIQPVLGMGDFQFDISSKVGDNGNYTKHWSNTYPPDPKADIIIFAAAYNTAYKRMSALTFIFITYDPNDNVISVERNDTFRRNYDPEFVYYTLHPSTDWIEGNYRVRIMVYDRLDRNGINNITNDPQTIGLDPDKYKTFFETGSNAADLGALLSQGTIIAQQDLNFNIDKSATLFPPDRFLLHDVRFVDASTERILGEKFRIEVKIDNNYKDDGNVRLAMLVDNNMVSSKDVSIKGGSTSTVIFEAKAGKIGSFKLHFGSDTQDVKYRNAELTFSIKEENESTRLDTPKISIKAMNIDKEFVPLGENVTVTVTAGNDGKSGTKTITVYSNKVPVGSADLEIKFSEEKTIEIPVKLDNIGINKITVSDAPSLFRNVFVQESSQNQNNPVVERIKENPLKLSMVVVFLVFAAVLYRLRKKLKEDEKK